MIAQMKLSIRGKNSLEIQYLKQKNSKFYNFHKMRKKQFMTLFQIYIFGHILSRAHSNLICNGDFQAYKTTTTVSASDGTSVTYVMIPQNYSCWYRLPHGDIQVQNQSYGFYTKNIELSDFFMQPYALCQNFSTKINSNYSLSLDFFTPKQITSSTTYVYLNNILVTSGTSVGYVTPMKLTYNFTSIVVTYMVCINGTIVKNSNTPIFADYSPQIDNVTVIEIIDNIANTTTSNSTGNNTSLITNTTKTNATNNTGITNSSVNTSTNPIINTTINTTTNFTNNTNPVNDANHSNIEPSLPPLNNITTNSTLNTTSPIVTSSIYFQLNLLMTTNDQQGYIQFQSELFIPYQIFLVFQSSSTIYISGEIQNHVTYLYNGDGTITATIYVERAYFLKDIQFKIPEQYIRSNTKIKIVVYINGRPIYIYFGTKNSVKSIQKVQLISQTLVNGISKGYDVMKACFCSYFVINIINFYSLTLFYNFLAIKSQPTFSHNSLEKISQIFYVRNSLIGYLSRQFNLTTLDISNAQFLTGDEQIIDQFYREYIWFGGMGIQEDFFRNNLESIILIFFAVFKLLMIKCFFKAFPNLMKFFFGNFQGFVQVVLIQLMCSSPMMTVSAFQNLLETGYHFFGCKINLFLHITLLFFIVFCPFMIFMSSRFRATMKWQILYKKKIRIKKNTDMLISKIDKEKTLKKSTAIDKYEMVYKKLYRRMQKYKYNRPYLKSIQYSLNILIPVTVVLRCQIAFFIVISIILFIILVLYVSRIKLLKISERIFEGLIIFIFIVHHICFFFMFLFQKMPQNWQAQLFSVCEIMGIIVIFTVATGGVLEVFRFLFKFLVQTKIKIRKLCDIAHEKQNEKQERKTKNNENNQNHTDYSIPPLFIKAEPIKKKQRTQHLTKQSSKQNNIEQKIAKLKEVEKRTLIKVCVKNSDKNSLYVLYNNNKQRNNLNKSKFNHQ